MLQLLRNGKYGARVLQRGYATEVKPRKVGALRGGFLGFLLGVSITGFGSYYYLTEQYSAANKAIISEVLLLEKTLGDLDSHVRKLEEKTK